MFGVKSNAVNLSREFQLALVIPKSSLPRCNNTSPCGVNYFRHPGINERQKNVPLPISTRQTNSKFTNCSCIIVSIIHRVLSLIQK